MGAGRVVRGCLAAAAALTGTVAVAPAASASCALPTIVRPEVVRRGETISIVGVAWYTECRDTGSDRPAPPLTGIEIAFEQGGRSFVVAHGSAGTATGFRADVRVPSELEPGPAAIVGRVGGKNLQGSDPHITISAAAPTTAEPAAIAELRPVDVPAPDSPAVRILTPLVLAALVGGLFVGWNALTRRLAGRPPGALRRGARRGSLTG